MDPNTRALMMGAAGAGGGEKIYVEDVFSTYLYTGNGSTQTITNGIDLAGKGGLVWVKGRSGATGHRLTDTARGATKSLESNSTTAEVTESTGLTSFSSTGFALGADADYNTNAATYASWTFRKAPKFFDVVTFTTTSGTVRNRRISHSLGSAPGMIIVKRTDGNNVGWLVYHRSTGKDSFGYLHLTSEFTANSNSWTTSDPTSTYFGIDELLLGGTSDSTYVAYLFAHDAGGFGDSGNESVIKCGTATDNTIVDLGWEPQWILIKPVNSTGDWHLVDNMRGLCAQTTGGTMLFPNSSTAENPSSYFRITSTGFHPGNIGWGNTIYIAIRRGPMKTPTDPTKVFSAVAQTPDTTAYSTGFTVDAVWDFSRQGDYYNTVIADRLRGRAALSTNRPDAEYANFVATWFQRNDGVNGPSVFGAGYPVGLLNFRRAPGFFDVVATTGAGTYGQKNHSLGVIPELIIGKVRTGSTTSNWAVYGSSLGGKLGGLNTSNAFIDNWGPSGPSLSSTTFEPWADSSSMTFIYYLFASCPGVSKVGSYTGTGNTLSINCGFTAGARFVMIKRTDSSADWYVWDTARGISSGNDPYILLNRTFAEVTNTTYIDPLSSGFEISSSAPAAINANGGSYIYLSVA